jgi:hypothetical protein
MQGQTERSTASIIVQWAEEIIPYSEFKGVDVFPSSMTFVKELGKGLTKTGNGFRGL